LGVFVLGGFIFSIGYTMQKRLLHGLIYGFVGQMRSGKTLSMIQLALDIASYREYGIVSNIPLNLEGIYKYAHFMGRRYDWLKFAVDCGHIFSIVNPADRDHLFRYPYKVIIFDEMGILLNSRSWKENSKSRFVEYLPQLGHLYCSLLYTAQFPEQIDATLRRLTSYIAFVSGVSKYRKNFKLYQNQGDINKIHIHKLIWRDIKFFRSQEFWNWYESDLRFRKPLSTIVKQFASWWGVLSKKHKLLFNCYDSHGKLGGLIDTKFPPVHSSFGCRLPYSYYQDIITKVCNDHYFQYLDPIRRKKSIYVKEFNQFLDENLDKNYKFVYDDPIVFKDFVKYDQYNNNGGKINNSKMFNSSFFED
jgi:hypothetical protein